jgi:hypothetical protein
MAGDDTRVLSFNPAGLPPQTHRLRYERFPASHAGRDSDELAQFRGKISIFTARNPILDFI